MGQVDFFLLCFPVWAGTVEQVCPLPLWLCSASSHSIPVPPATNCPRSRDTRQSTWCLLQWQAMPLVSINSQSFIWDGFLLTIKLAFTNGEHFTASLWSYCSMAVKFNSAPTWPCLDLPASWWLMPRHCFLCGRRCFFNKRFKRVWHYWAYKSSEHFSSFNCVPAQLCFQLIIGTFNSICNFCVSSVVLCDLLLAVVFSQVKCSISSLGYSLNSSCGIPWTGNAQPCCPRWVDLQHWCFFQVFCKEISLRLFWLYLTWSGLDHRLFSALLVLFPCHVNFVLTAFIRSTGIRLERQ